MKVLLLCCLVGLALAKQTLDLNLLEKDELEILDKVNAMYDRGEDVEKFVKENNLEHLFKEEYQDEDQSNSESKK